MGRGSLVGCRLWGHRVGHDWSDLAAAAASYGFVWWLNSKESAGNAGDTGDASLISGLGRSSGGGNGYPLQYSCRENPMDRGAWWATVHGFTELDRTEDRTERLTVWLSLYGITRGAVIKNPPASVGDMVTQVPSLVGKIPWSRKWQPPAVFLPEKHCGQRSLEGYSPWGQTWLSAHVTYFHSVASSVNYYLLS